MKLIPLLLLASCSFASYKSEFTNIGGLVHGCNNIMVGNQLKVGYTNCTPLEVSNRDVQEYVVTLEVPHDI